MHWNVRSPYLAWALGSDHLYPEVLVLPAGWTHTQHILGSTFNLMIKPMSFLPPTDLPVSCLTHILYSPALCTLTCRPQLLARDAVFPLSSQFPSLHSFCLTLFGDGLVAKSWLTLATPWSVACQSPLSMGFSRQENWSGTHFLLQGIFPAQGSNLGLLHCRQTLYWESDHLYHYVCVCVNICLFTYLWLCWVFAAAHGLSLVVMHGILIEVTSLVVEHKLCGVRASVVAACGLVVVVLRL